MEETQGVSWEFFGVYVGDGGRSLPISFRVFLLIELPTKLISGKNTYRLTVRCASAKSEWSLTVVG